jgi:hypothetical protein
MQPMHAERYKRSYEWTFFTRQQILRTLATRHRPPNREGLAIALQRYKLTMSLDSLRRESTTEGEAAFQ